MTSNTEILALPEVIFSKSEFPAKFCRTCKFGETFTSRAIAEPTYETVPVLSIENGISSPDTPPNKLFPKLSYIFAMSNISFFSLSTSLINLSLSFVDKTSFPLSTAIS